MENEYSAAVLFPNPTNGFFEIKNINEAVPCFLINTLGERVAEFISNEKVRAGHLTAGLYWVVVDMGNGKAEKMPLYIR